MDLNNLDDVEQLKRLIVDPLIENIRAELRPVAKTTYANRNRLNRMEGDIAQLEAGVKTEADNASRLSKLESNQKKAMLGYAGIVMLTTAAFNYLKVKIMAKFS